MWDPRNRRQNGARKRTETSLIELPLLQKELENLDKLQHARQAFHDFHHVLGSFGPVCHVETDVKRKPGGHIIKLDNRHFGLCDHLQDWTRFGHMVPVLEQAGNTPSQRVLYLKSDTLIQEDSRKQKWQYECSNQALGAKIWSLD